MAQVEVGEPARGGRARRVALVVVAAVVVGWLANLGLGALGVGFSLTATLAAGLQTGSVYALIALGVALVYRSTRVINFAQGELGTVPAYVLLTVLLGGDLVPEIGAGDVTVPSMVVGIALAMVVGAGLAIVINLGIIQRLASASPVTALVATTGISLLLIGVQVLVFDVRLRSFPPVIAGAPSGFEFAGVCLAERDGGECLGAAGRFAIGGSVIPWNSVLIVAVLVVVSVLLAGFFRSRRGIALLATAQDPFAAELYGVSTRAMGAMVWGFAGAFGALAGVLGAGLFQTVHPGLMTSRVLVPGLVAAVLGGITSMPGAVVGGLLVGIIGTLANQVVLEADLTAAVPGAPTAAVFVVLLLVLVVRPRGLLGRDA